MKRIGFLSFGHWRAAPGSQTQTASDTLLQTIELAQAAVPNQLGVAYNARILATIASHIAPAIGWTPGVAAGHLT